MPELMCLITIFRYNALMIKYANNNDKPFFRNINRGLNDSTVAKKKFDRSSSLRDAILHIRASSHRIS